MNRELSALELARQLKKPEGEIGLKIAESMNINNLEITKEVYQKMQLSPTNRVLEIGYGNGKLLSFLYDIEKNLKVYGIDISETMYEAAVETNNSFIQNNCMELTIGNVLELPYQDEMFDHVCTINTIYFWNNPLMGFREIFRVLKPGGRLYLNLTKKEDLLKLETSGYEMCLYDELELTIVIKDSGLELNNQWLFEENIEIDGTLQSFSSIIFELKKPEC